MDLTTKNSIEKKFTTKIFAKHFDVKLFSRNEQIRAINYFCFESTSFNC